MKYVGRVLVLVTEGWRGSRCQLSEKAFALRPGKAVFRYFLVSLPAEWGVQVACLRRHVFTPRVGAPPSFPCKLYTGEHRQSTQGRACPKVGLQEGVCCYSWLLNSLEGRDFYFTSQEGNFRRISSCPSLPIYVSSPEEQESLVCFVNSSECAHSLRLRRPCP